MKPTINMHNKPYIAETIRFKDDRDDLHDLIVLVSGSFVIAFTDENDDAPNWYNADCIESLI